MGLLKVSVILALVFAGFAVLINKAIQPPPVPKIEETWWGPGLPTEQDKSVKPFKINISEKDIKDLKYRLDNHRTFVPPLEGISQQYGLNTNLLKEIVDFWRTKYNWKEREQYLNQFPQYKTNIQGLDIHFLHVKPKITKNVKVLPLLIVHGWPGSVREFYDIIPILTTPKNGIVFEVIAPSIPGYGFSQAAIRPGLGAAQIAVVMKNLMHRLGFQKFYAQGGDFGAIILQQLSVIHPEVLYGFHSNMCTVQTLRSFLWTLVGVIYPDAVVRKEHYHRVYPMGTNFARLLKETGYLHLQATKPDTIGVAMSDSPVGLAAYILEKFITGYNSTYLEIDYNKWKNDWFPYTDLLDNIMIYWWTNSMQTAFRLYSETFNKAHSSLGGSRIPISIPTACARFEHDFYASDKALEEIYPNSVQLTDHKGGHFAAMQLPKVLADDIFSAVLKFEDIRHKKQ